MSTSAAAHLAEAALADTLAAVAACNADVKIVAIAGQPGPWVPSGLRVVAQEGRGFDQRLAHAWAHTAQHTGGHGIQIGMDTPQVTPDELDGLLDVLVSRPAPGALLGPAVDGGWWAIGLAGTDPYRVFPGVAMSTSHTAAMQLARLRALGLDPCVVHAHRDIDTVADLAVVSAAYPQTHTARAWRRWLTSTDELAS
jgi:hypothetical protein